MSATEDADVVVVGAGFYGLAVAVHRAAAGLKVLVLDEGERPMERASAVNQARVHTGFHYPRSYSTALRSLHNRDRFVEDYGPAVRSDFRMLYAVARHGTKVNARRFAGMFEAMRSPISRASASQRALFDSDLVEDVFDCVEFAFDWTTLRTLMLERAGATGTRIDCASKVDRISADDGACSVHLSDGRVVRAGEVFNVTYSGINRLLKSSGLATIPLKHEFVEIALMDPPEEMAGTAVTLMDGEFFSSMPWPSEGAYSLTHVRHTPHCSWTDADAPVDAYAMAEALPRRSRWRHMVNDSRRYMPCIGDMRFRRSLFDVKTVPVRNEADDGRPILLHRDPAMPGLTSVLGSKIDNVYDLLEAVS